MVYNKVSTISEVGRKLQRISFNNQNTSPPPTRIRFMSYTGVEAFMLPMIALPHFEPFYFNVVLVQAHKGNEPTCPRPPHTSGLP